MGADYTALAAIGLAFKPENLKLRKKIKTFEHSYPEDYIYCPKTQRPLWIEKMVPYTSFDGRHLEGYTVISDGSDVKIACIYAVGGKTDSNGGPTMDMSPLSTIDLNKAREAMKSLLEPLGIWDEKEFGLWAVLHCSV